MMKIIQTVNFGLASAYVIISVWRERLGRAGYGAALGYMVMIFGVYMIEFFVVWGKTYNHGTPFFVSGSCMLLEFNPTLGYYDSEISTYWKGLMSCLGI
jgi:hypothetical protein